jgi:hypothetical protein
MKIAESKWRLALSMSSAPLLLLLVWAAWQVGAAALFVVPLAAFALGLGWVILVDLPTAIEVGPDEINRVCLLRAQPVAWGHIAAIVRPKRGSLVLVTDDRKRVVLVSRKLTDSETDFIANEAMRRNVRVEI